MDRQKILDKFRGHCAYCGKEINLKTMQVDHKLSKHLGGTDNFENLFPSCGMCNHYKRAGDLEYFRWLLTDMLRKLQKIYIFRVAENYKMFNWESWDGKFYFEKEAKINGD